MVWIWGSSIIVQGKDQAISLPVAKTYGCKFYFKKNRVKRERPPSTTPISLCLPGADALRHSPISVHLHTHTHMYVPYITPHVITYLYTHLYLSQLNHTIHNIVVEVVRPYVNAFILPEAARGAGWVYYSLQQGSRVGLTPWRTAGSQSGGPRKEQRMCALAG